MALDKKQWLAWCRIVSFKQGVWGYAPRKKDVKRPDLELKNVQLKLKQELNYVIV